MMQMTTFWILLSICFEAKFIMTKKIVSNGNLLRNIWSQNISKGVDGSIVLSGSYRIPIGKMNLTDAIYSRTFIPRDCSDIKRKRPKAHSGVYKIFPSGGRGYDVLCDMETDTGGWTVFHKRFDGSVNFYRNWKDYKQGFGSVRGEFWLGLQALHEVTVHGQHELRVDLADFEGNTRYAKYSKFSISNESNGYQILVGGYTGTAGESMEHANGMKFTTKDRDNDKYSNNCAIVHGGAWWFKDCFRAHLNGRYTNDPKSLKKWKGLIWNTWKGSKYSLKSDVMMVRRHHN